LRTHPEATRSHPERTSASHPGRASGSPRSMATTIRWICSR